MAINKITRFFAMAAKAAIKETTHRRDSIHGCVGIRADGAIVTSKNLPTQLKNPKVHAEYLLCRKLDSDATAFVVRLNRTGTYTNSRPCIHCQIAMRQRGVKKCYYTINETEYGVMKF